MLTMNVQCSDSHFSSWSSASCTLITGWQVDYDSVADLLVVCTGEVDEPIGLQICLLSLDDLYYTNNDERVGEQRKTLA